MGQQQDAFAYVYWGFGPGTPPFGQNIDQQVWIPGKGAKTFWALVWKWTADRVHGGYIGLQTDAEYAEGQYGDTAIFSLWNATAAEGPGWVEEFGGEGTGWQCRLAFPIRTDCFYRLRLWRLEADPDGQWWGAWIIEETSPGTLTHHYIGRCKVAADLTDVAADSIENFSEFWGDAVTECRDVPLSVAGFTPPAASYLGSDSGEYLYYSSKSGATDPDANPCQPPGDGSSGAMSAVDDFDFGFAQGVKIFLGGSPPYAHTDPQPRDMPNG